MHAISRPRPVVSKEEIAAIEKRFEQLRPDGDCGYENAMIRFYQQQLGMRRKLLGGAG